MKQSKPPIQAKLNGTKEEYNEFVKWNRIHSELRENFTLCPPTTLEALKERYAELENAHRHQYPPLEGYKDVVRYPIPTELSRFLPPPICPIAEALKEQLLANPELLHSTVPRKRLAEQHPDNPPIKPPAAIPISIPMTITLTLTTTLTINCHPQSSQPTSETTARL
jgi:hypothetical protein